MLNYLAAVVAIDVFLKSFIIVSTHCRGHVAGETGFKQDSPNLNPLIQCSFLLTPDSDSQYIRIQII